VSAAAAEGAFKGVSGLTPAIADAIASGLSRQEGDEGDEGEAGAFTEGKRKAEKKNKKWGGKHGAPYESGWELKALQPMPQDAVTKHTLGLDDPRLDK